LKASWDSYWFGPVAAARPFTFVRGVLLLLAFDLWLDMPDHGARYDVAGFNVSQLFVLDLLYPIPSAALYVGVVLLAGLFAFTGAVAGFTRPIAIVTSALYTFGWTMSMFDSYQHHYLLSIVLIGCAILPSSTAIEVFGSPLDDAKRMLEVSPASGSRARAWSDRIGVRLAVGVVATAVMCWLAFNLERSGWLVAGIAVVGVGATVYATFFGPLTPPVTRGSWGYALASVSIAIVYFYTGISKTEPNWRSGIALQNIAGPKLAPYQAWAESTFGIDGATFHPLMGFGVIAVQWVIAAAYLVAPLRDRHWLFAVPAWAGFFAAMSFHLGAEYLGLEIGWFSWYMVLTACVFLLPGSALDAVGRIVTWPARALVVMFPALEGDRKRASRASKSDASEGSARGKAKKKARKNRAPELRPEPAEVVAPRSVPLAQLVPIAAAGMLILPIAGYVVDLPGALVAGIVAALALGGFVAWRVSSHEGRGVRPVVAAASVAAFAMLVAISVSDVRYDFYRRLGSQNRRQENWVAAYDAYKQANRYAPEGESRERQLMDVHFERCKAADGDVAGTDADRRRCWDTWFDRYGDRSFEPASQHAERVAHARGRLAALPEAR
jgi:hypothetical protein